MNKQKNIVKGMLWAGTASISWGVSGTVLQLISQNLAIPAHWMLSMRTSAAGAILLIISAILYRGKIFNVFKSWPSVISLFSYAVFGLMANLYTFYYAVQTGNASMATILQYLSPLFIVFGGWFFQHSRPLKSDLLSFVIAMAGVFLCLTKGNFGHLAIPLNSFLWGLGSGITAAFYVVLPQKAAEENSPLVVLGWGTAIAGGLFNLYQPFWVNPPHITGTLVASVSTVVLFGTIIPFGMLMHATKFAPSDVVSIMDALQPIVTAILSVIFFKEWMNWIEILGIVLVILAIYILQNGRRKGHLEQEYDLHY
ncbi:DMT family transporter [Limosilactobacillus mucosae]|uniref:DMT family transporter n=1 Tax=Limosilactobacillus mucosae TaxID=97478 RepID=UPI0039935986